MYDVIVVGGGPGGYGAALYARNFGLSVALVERDTIGGTCLLRGCIPAKSWLQSAEVYSTVRSARDFGVITGDPRFDWPVALRRKDRIVKGLVRGLAGLLRYRKVDVVRGTGHLAGVGKVEVEEPGGFRLLEGRHVILATGSAPVELPGFPFDGQRIVSSDHALDWPERPGRVGIVGGGIVGCEFASLLADVGSEVVVFEMLDQLIPGFEPGAARELRKQLQRRGVTFVLGSGAELGTSGDRTVLQAAGGADGFEVDTILVAVGRRPVTDGLGLDTVGLGTDRGFLRVDPDTMQTAQAGVFAVGDIVAGTPGLAHGAFAEAVSAITFIATGSAKPVDYRALPSVVYTHPEVAAVGLTEAQAVAAGLEVESHDHSFFGVGRARIIGRNRGFVKILNEVGGPIVGATVVGPQAGELIHELMYMVGWEALPEEAAAFVHAHPTLSEATGETLMAAAGLPLH
ncbi:MAG: dihydrolipoyl dehydrogenase [bacterium]|nr:dihydrolipoyl dehydrogenase [bacterium]MDE0287182.1 dihydrolipoyl dehydrogenase [bacterium]MDE0437163.1 dihydrolipoyl dehydrogenase [bacterium]